MEGRSLGINTYKSSILDSRGRNPRTRNGKSVVSDLGTREEPTHLPLLYYTRFLSCIYG